MNIELAPTQSLTRRLSYKNWTVFENGSGISAQKWNQGGQRCETQTSLRYLPA